MKTLIAVLLLSISSLAMGLQVQPNRMWQQAPQPYQQQQYQQYQQPYQQQQYQQPYQQQQYQQYQQPYQQQQQQMGIPSIQNGRLIYSH